MEAASLWIFACFFRCNKAGLKVRRLVALRKKHFFLLEFLQFLRMKDFCRRKGKVFFRLQKFRPQNENLLCL